MRQMNVLIDNGGKAVLCNFGLLHVRADATSQTAALYSSNVGNQNWMAPERLIGGSLQKPSHIYTFGMTIFKVRLCLFQVSVKSHSMLDLHQRNSSRSY